MRRFSTASRLSAWTGVAPGNDESTGKQRSGKTRKGNRTLRTGLTQIAHAAVRTKGTYLSALYQRLAARRGKQRAIWPSPMPSSSVPSIGSLSINLIVSWGPTTLMLIGVTTSSTA